MMSVASLKKQAAFTLIEVAIAVGVLSYGIVTLLGMQTSITSRTVADKLRTQAMLGARAVLAVVENTQEPLAATNFEGRLEDIITEIMGITPPTFDNETSLSLQGSVVVNDLVIPGFELPLLQQITIVVEMGDIFGGTVEVQYLKPLQTDAL